MEFNLPNYQKYMYTVKVLGATLLLVKLSSLIKTYLRGGKTTFRGADCPPCSPIKKPLNNESVKETECVSNNHSTVHKYDQ
jgi:hypothetical protein